MLPELTQGKGPYQVRGRLIGNRHLGLEVHRHQVVVVVAGVVKGPEVRSLRKNHSLDQMSLLQNT